MFSLRLTGVSFALIIAVACGSDYSTPPTGPSPTLAPTPGRATSGVAIQAGADALGTVPTRQRSSTWRSAPALPGLATIPEGRTADSDAGLEFRSRPASRRFSVTFETAGTFPYHSASAPEGWAGSR